LSTVRVIHGKGTGALRERVHAWLRGSPLVESFAACDESSGGWGATRVRLRGTELKNKKPGAEAPG
jgi:DNA-nicking Smr family endonuclease